MIRAVCDHVGFFGCRCHDISVIFTHHNWQAIFRLRQHQHTVPHTTNMSQWNVLCGAERSYAITYFAIHPLFIFTIYFPFTFFISLSLPLSLLLRRSHSVEIFSLAFAFVCGSFLAFFSGQKKLHQCFWFSICAANIHSIISCVVRVLCVFHIWSIINWKGWPKAFVQRHSEAAPIEKKSHEMRKINTLRIESNFMKTCSVCVNVMRTQEHMW